MKRGTNATLDEQGAELKSQYKLHKDLPINFCKLIGISGTNITPQNSGNAIGNALDIEVCVLHDGGQGILTRTTFRRQNDQNSDRLACGARPKL